MGGALVRAAVKAVCPSQILITDKDEAKGAELARETGVQQTDLQTLASESSCIFLGVKPQAMAGMLSEIRPILDQRKDSFFLITMAAGLTISRINEFSGLCPTIRIMPNLAVSVGEGMILYASERVEEEALRFFKCILSKAGTLLPIEEKLIDAGSSISGCGPAFVCMFIEALSDAGVSIGLKRADALLLAEQTVLGTASLLLGSGLHPAVLKDNVCSPGGTTIAGVLAADQEGLRKAAEAAVRAAYLRTLEIK